MTEGLSGIPAGVVKPLANVANNLIDRISSAVVTVYEPVHLRRLARADADAKRISALSDLKTELEVRTLRRLIAEEAKKQENIEAIVDEAISELKHSAKPEDISDDWMSHFFEHSKKVSDNEMRILWARVLAGEANQVGSFTKRTLNTISLLEKSDASIFIEACKFYSSSLRNPLIYLDSEIYEGNGVTFGSLIKLESLVL